MACACIVIANFSILLLLHTLYKMCNRFSSVHSRQIISLLSTSFCQNINDSCVNTCNCWVLCSTTLNKFLAPCPYALPCLVLLIPLRCPRWSNRPRSLHVESFSGRDFGRLNTGIWILPGRMSHSPASLSFGAWEDRIIDRWGHRWICFPQ